MAKYEPLYQQQIIDELAKEFDLKPKQVRKAVMHQFEFIRKVMKKGDFESVRLRYFGKFKVNPKRLENLQQSNEQNS